jgi:uncharacterized protein
MASPIPEGYGRAVVEKRWYFLLLVLALSAVAAGLSVKSLERGLPVDFTPQAIFFDDGEELMRLREIEETFGREDNDLVFMFEGGALSVEGMRTMATLHRELETHPEVVRVDSLYNAKRAAMVDGMLEVEELWTSSPEDLLEKALGENHLRGAVVSEDGDAALLRVRINPQHEKVADLQPVIEELVGRAKAMTLPEGITLTATGVPFIRTEVVQMMLADDLFYAPVLTCIFLSVICLLFRRVSLGLAPMAGVGIAVLWAMGTLLGSGVTFNVLSILVPILTLVIGTADGIHLAARYREELHRDGKPEAAMGRTMRYMSTACFLTTFTTAAGFLSLMVADTSVIRDFGLHSAVAVMTAYFAVMLVVPTWLAFIPKEWVGEPTISRPGEKRLFDGIDLLVRRRPGQTAIAVLFVSGCAAIYGSGVRPNSSILEMYHHDHPTHRAVKAAEEKLSGIVPIFIHFEALEGDLLEPGRLAMMAEVEQVLDAEEIVLWTTSFAGQLGAIHRLLGGEEGLPDSRALAAQELLLAEMAGELPLDKVVDPERRKARILALCSDAGGRSYIEMHGRMTAHVERILKEEKDLRVDVTGDGLMASLGIDALIRDLLSSLAIVLAVISLTLLALLRDLRLAAIATIPNFLPLVFTLATLQLIGADLQTSNIVSFTVAVGLAVDDTIHFIVRYRQELQAGRSHEEAITASFHGAGHAIVLTTILLVAGFGTLATSQLTTTYHFGLLSSVTLAAAVLADLFLLPSMLHMDARSRAQKT